MDLVVSTETPLAELIPTFVELSVDEPPTNGAPVWSVAPPGRAAARRSTARSAESGVADGTVLELTQLRSAGDGAAVAGARARARAAARHAERPHAPRRCPRS